MKKTEEMPVETWDGTDPIAFLQAIMQGTISANIDQRIKAALELSKIDVPKDRKARAKNAGAQEFAKWLE